MLKAPQDIPVPIHSAHNYLHEVAASWLTITSWRLDRKRCHPGRILVVRAGNFVRLGCGALVVYAFDMGIRDEGGKSGCRLFIERLRSTTPMTSGCPPEAITVQDCGVFRIRVGGDPTLEDLPGDGRGFDQRTVGWCVMRLVESEVLASLQAAIPFKPPNATLAR